MKKILSLVMAMCLTFAMGATAFAADVPLGSNSVATITNGITPNAVLSFNFTNLPAGSNTQSSETYYISNSNATLTISSCTWSPASQNVHIGFYNVSTGTLYYVTYSGGAIYSQGINSSGIPNGDYRVCVQNAGTSSITGTIQYRVS